jgi:hypothetical protein
VDRIYDRKAWDDVRRSVLVRDRYCCRTPGCGEPTKIVDHVVPLSRGGASLDPANPFREAAAAVRRERDVAKSTPRTCPGCGETFVGRPERRTCSARCRQRVSRTHRALNASPA